MKNLIISILLFLSISVFSQSHLHRESYYQDYFAQKTNGETEHVLDDRTRVDVLVNEYSTKIDYAIEVDFASKWAEGIGQALYYALKTNKKPGVLLIMEDPEKDQKYLDRLLLVANKYDITVWTINAELNIDIVRK